MTAVVAEVGVNVPPAPIWRDETTYLAVYVNGGYVEISMADGWSGRLMPDEIASVPTSFAQAIETARSWAARWDGRTRTYRPAVDPECAICESTDCIVPFLNTHVCAHCLNTATLGDARDAMAAR
ncbi:hypothetical protein H7J86_26065 [Mycobacterium hackensackense]|uniref:hypothetical protein n=1 Tax=Mycobacterium hackensackense TaxID=228909 RepID=UPI0022658A46|nr:hypothetical protein [Mycobacterium hackensackense]MCV7255634.1 hypothetical protein [Mycobacterium hackensackense]